MSTKKKRLVKELESLSDHLRLDGQESRATAYSNAAESVRSVDVIPPDPADMDFVGESIRDDILAFYRHGEIERLEQLREQYPYLDQLRVVDGVGPKIAQRLYQTLGIEHVGELVDRQNELTMVDGIGEKRASNIASAAHNHIDDIAERKPIEYVGKTMAHVSTILFDAFEDELIENADGKYLPFVIIPTGSYRRQEDMVGDLDILVVPDYRDDPVDEVRIFDAICDGADRVFNRGAEKCSVIINKMQVDFLLTREESLGAAMQYFTGSKNHNIKMRSHAREQGYKLNEYGLFDRETGEKIAGESEKAIYEELGVDYVEPQNRDGHQIDPP